MYSLAETPHPPPDPPPAFGLIREQCCGSGIWDSVPFWPLDPRSGMGKNQDPDPGWTTRIKFPRAYKQFFGLKYLNSLWIRDPGWKKFGCGDKHPGSATLYTSALLVSWDRRHLFVTPCPSWSMNLGISLNFHRPLCWRVFIYFIFNLSLLLSRL